MLKEEFNDHLLADESFDQTSVITQLLENNTKSSVVYYLCRTFYLLVYNSDIIRKDENNYQCYINDDSLIPAASQLNDTIKYLSEKFDIDQEAVKNDLFYVINRYYTETAYPEELENQFSIIRSNKNSFVSKFGPLYDSTQFPNWDQFEQRVRAFV